MAVPFVGNFSNRLYAIQLPSICIAFQSGIFAQSEVRVEGGPPRSFEEIVGDGQNWYTERMFKPDRVFEVPGTWVHMKNDLTSEIKIKYSWKVPGRHPVHVGVIIGGDREFSMEGTDLTELIKEFGQGSSVTHSAGSGINHKGSQQMSGGKTNQFQITEPSNEGTDTSEDSEEDLGEGGVDGERDAGADAVMANTADEQDANSKLHLRALMSRASKGNLCFDLVTNKVQWQRPNSKAKPFVFNENSRVQKYRYEKGWVLRFINCGKEKRAADTKPRVKSTVAENEARKNRLVQDVIFHIPYESAGFEHYRYGKPPGKSFNKLNYADARHNSKYLGQFMDRLRTLLSSIDSSTAFVHEDSHFVEGRTPEDPDDVEIQFREY